MLKAHFNHKIIQKKIFKICFLRMSKFVLHLVHFRWSLEVVKRVSHDQVHHLYTKILERSRMF